MKKILVIEDDEPLCWLLNFILTKKHEVTLIKNGLDAMTWLADNSAPDLIITDLEIPGLNGLEVLTSLKSSGLYKDIPVIVLSGNVDAKVKTRCLQQGAACFVLKPFDPQSLLEEVGKVLSHTTKIEAINEH